MFIDAFWVDLRGVLWMAGEYGRIGVIRGPA